MTKSILILLVLTFLLAAENASAFGPITAGESRQNCRQFLELYDNAAAKPKEIGPYEIYSMYQFCRLPILFDGLNSAEQQQLLSLLPEAETAKARLRSEEIEQISQYIAFVEPNIENDACAQDDPEGRKDDLEIRRVWMTMLHALERGNIEDALTYFEPKSQGAYRSNFDRLSKEDLAGMAQEMKNIVPDQQQGNTATYHLLKGETRSFQLSFRRTQQCSWKIVSF